MENNEFKVPETNLGWLKGQIEKLNRRATKLNMPLIELVILGEEVTQICKCEIFPCAGTCPYRKYIKVEIKGQAPSINGWDFIGTIAHIEEGSNILQLLPGQTVPESYRQADPKNCDHCHVNRKRTSTYILVNAQNEYKQVGKQCLQDFFKQDVSNIVARAELLAVAGGLKEASENWGSSGNGQQYYKLSDYLANVLAVVEKHGFVSRAKADEWNKVPTSTSAAMLMISPRGKEAQELGVRVSKEHEAKAAEIIAWIETYLDKQNLSDYEHNLKVVVDLGYCDWRTFGLAASITALHWRETAAKAEKTAKKPSEYVGEVGKRIKGLTLTLVKITSLGDGEFGMRYLYRFLDANENVLVWFTGNVLDADTRNFFENTVYTGDVSVKEHSEYKGTKQTVVTRCKLFSPELRAKFDVKEEVK